VVVVPRARIDGSAAEPDKNGDVLNADGALELACAAGCAFEDSFLRVVLAEEGSAEEGQAH